MPRYYFDIRDNDEKATDDIGLELPSLKLAEVEAAQSLADIIRETPTDADHHGVAIEVRTDDGPVFKAAFIYEATRH